MLSKDYFIPRYFHQWQARLNNHAPFLLAHADSCMQNVATFCFLGLAINCMQHIHPARNSVSLNKLVVDMTTLVCKHN